MSHELRKTVGHAGIFTIGIILNRAISFVMLPIYTRFLTPADYGILELLEMTVDVASIVTGMGIVNGLFKFYYQYENNHDKEELVSTLFILVIFSYLFACFLGGVSSSTISSLIFGTEKYSFYIILSFFNLFLQFLIYTPLAYVRAQQKSLFYVIVTSIKLAMQLLLNIVFVVHFEMGVAGVLYSTMLSSLAIGGWLAYYTFSKVRLQFSIDKAKELIAFGFPFIVSGLGAFILTFSDRYFLNYYRNLSEVGLYALAYKFGFLLMMFPVQPLMNIWMVQRFELAAKERHETAFNQFLSWFFIITLTVALVVALTVHDVLRVMSSPAFWDAYKIVPIILFAYFMQACTDFFNFGIYQSGKTKHIAYGTVLAVVVILALSFLLIPPYGIQGAAWATLISFAVRLVYIYYASQNLFKINYHLLRPVSTTAIAISIYLIYMGSMQWFQLSGEMLISIARTILLLTLFFALLIRLDIITANEKKLIFSSIRSPLKTIAEFKGQHV